MESAIARNPPRRLLLSLAMGAVLLTPVCPQSRIETSPGYQASIFYAADIRAPESITVGPDGDLYVADDLAWDVVRIEDSGRVTIAAQGVQAMDVAFGPAGQLFVMTHRQVLQLLGSGELTVYASADSLPRVGNSGGTFFAIAVSPTGELFSVDKATGALYRVDAAGTPSIVATNLAIPVDLAFSPSGELFVAERGLNRIVKVDATGRITPFASAAFAPPVDPGEEPAWAEPVYMAFAPDGSLYVHGFLGVFRISPNGAVSQAMAGGQDIAIVLPSRVVGDLAFDEDGNLYVADAPGAKISKVPPSGRVEILVPGFNPNDIEIAPGGDVLAIDSESWPISPSTLTRITASGSREVLATFNGIPEGLAIGPEGDVYVSLIAVPDVGGQILKVLPDGRVTPVLAGESPWRIAVNPSGQVFFVNAASGNISFVSEGKAIPFATGFSDIFTSIGFDASGNLYATDTANGALVRISASGERETVAVIPDLRDRPQDITVAPSGDVYAVAHWRYILWHISPTGMVEELAARVLIDPFGIDLASDGSIYVSRSGSIDVIRRQ